MDIIDFSDKFYKMEQDLKLFQSKIDECYWWDIVRHDVFYQVYYGINNVEINPVTNRSTIKRATTLIHIIFKRIQLFIKINLFQHNIIALSAPRNSNNCKRTDVILEDILGCIKGSKLIITTVPVYYHIPKRKKIKHTIPAQLYIELENEIEARFGQRFSVVNLITDLLHKFNHELSVYRKLINTVKPEFIVLVQNGIEKALIHAAHLQNIPTIEAQHGLINYVHPAYSYPKNIVEGNLSTIPNFFLSFARHWNQSCYYPVEKYIVCGNNYFSVDKVKNGDKKILFISATIYASILEGYLIHIAKILPKKKFIYKLHPNQYAQQNSIAQKFSQFSNIEVVADEKSISQLVQDCSSAVCVQSTAVYEILQANLSLYLVQSMDYKTHVDIFDHPNCTLVSSVEKLGEYVSKERKKKTNDKNPIYFDKFNYSEMSKFFESFQK